MGFQRRQVITNCSGRIAIVDWLQQPSSAVLQLFFSCKPFSRSCQCDRISLGYRYGMNLGFVVVVQFDVVGIVVVGIVVDMVGDIVIDIVDFGIEIHFQVKTPLTSTPCNL